AEQRKLADSLINEVQTSLKDVPHTIPTQRLLAQKSLDYLNNMARDAGNDPSFLSELASAYLNVGYLQSWTLQDNTNALLTYQKGIDLLRRRLALEPNSTAAKRQLSDSLSNRLEALTLMDSLDEAAATYAEKLGLEQELLAGDPRNPQQIITVAETNEGCGEILQGLKRADEANSKFQTAGELDTEEINLLTQPAQGKTHRIRFCY